MKKNILFVFALLFLQACITDFEETNTNPNSPVDVQPNLLLRKVLFKYGEEMSYEGFVAGNLLGQYFTAIDFNLFDRHALNSPQLGGNPWPVLYTNLRDNEIIITKSRTIPANKVYEGPALIFKAYMTATLTDLYGDVPYSEGFKGIEGTTTPKYDAQEAIYTAPGGILDNLDKGIAAIQNYSATIPLQGDIIFNGNLASWIKFANSLKIKALLRISSKVNVTNELQAIYNSGNYLNDASQNAIYNFTVAQPNNFRMSQVRIGEFRNFVMSETIENILANLNDPRIGVLFRTTGSGTTSIYNGLRNGIDAANLPPNFTLNDYSFPGTIFRENAGNLKLNYMTSWETKFLLAEAAQKGIIVANAQSLYEQGVTEAFAYWQTPLPATYLTTTAAYNANGNNPLEQIMTQKWISNIINGYEGWIEYKRTGFPQLLQVSASLNNNIIPVRMPYPAEEATLNTTNYNAAAAATNGNSINFKVWWNQ